MWMFIKGWYYNLNNYIRIKIEGDELYMKELGDSNITIIHDLEKEEIVKIKQILNGRNN